MDALKILVVDDESRMRKLVSDFLTKKNFQVLEAGDGEEAIDIFYAEKDVALIILDVMMPKMDGWEVCREIRKNSKVPIIMLTARGDERDELLGFELGPWNITVNCVAPGPIGGGMFASLPAENREKLLQGIRLGRIGTFEDVASAIAYLGSDDASWTTGEVLDVNGGLQY